MLNPLVYADTDRGQYIQFQLDVPLTLYGSIPTYNRFGFLGYPVPAADQELNFNQSKPRRIRAWRFSVSFEINTALTDGIGGFQNVPFIAKGIAGNVGSVFKIGSATYISFLAHKSPFWGVGSPSGLLPPVVNFVGDRHAPQTPVTIVPTGVEFVGRVFFDFELFQ